MPAVFAHRATILLSGGLDSATALAAFGREHSVNAAWIGYGQAAERAERNAAQNLARAFDIQLREILVSGDHFGAGEIVGRNAFLVHAALLGLGPGPVSLVMGIHAGTDYRDCTPEFGRVMQASLDFHRDGEVQLVLPFVTWQKSDIYGYAIELDVPIDMTWSCEDGGEIPCGSCLSCGDRERLLASA
jgi:7-cyano-7-deazaguanine synthase